MNERKRERKTNRNEIVGLCFASQGIPFPVVNGKQSCIISLSSPSIRTHTSLYNPVLGSGCGASRTNSPTSNHASPTWSLLDSLSQSRTVSWTLKEVSYRRTWKRSFSSQVGLSEWRMMRVRKIFLEKEMTTNGSMSKPVRVTGERKRLVYDTSHNGKRTILQPRQITSALDLKHDDPDDIIRMRSGEVVIRLFIRP